TNGSSATTLLRWSSDAARRARVALRPGRLACRGARLSLEADPSHRAVPAGRADRHRRPSRRPEALGGTRPASRRRQSRRRRGHCRLHRRRKGAAGRTPPHLAAELFKTVAGVDLLHVPYKGGAPAINDLVGGQVQAIFEGQVVLLPHIKSGKVRALAITGAKRDPALADVPTFAE